MNYITPAAVDMHHSMTGDEEDLLNQCEYTISRHIGGFVAVGNALKIINDQRLYRDQFKTFPAYLRERWDFSESRGYQMIEAADVVSEVSTIGGEIANERQARALTEIPTGDRGKVWQAVLDSEEKITSRAITQTARAIGVLRPLEPIAKQASSSADDAARFRIEASIDFLITKYGYTREMMLAEVTDYIDSALENKARKDEQDG